MKVPLRFSSSFAEKEVVTINEIAIPFLNYNDLVEDKKANARPKDLNDIENLKNRREDKDQ